MDITSGFVAGQNVIDFYVEGNGRTDGMALNPISFTAGVPEPASLTLLGIAAACGFAYFGLRRNAGAASLSAFEGLRHAVRKATRDSSSILTSRPRMNEPRRLKGPPMRGTGSITLVRLGALRDVWSVCPLSPSRADAIETSSGLRPRLLSGAL